MKFIYVFRNCIEWLSNILFQSGIKNVLRFTLYYKDGEERSEGPDAQCREKKVYYKTTTQDVTQQKKSKLVGYPSGRPPPW